MSCKTVNRFKKKMLNKYKGKTCTTTVRLHMKVPPESCYIVVVLLTMIMRITIVKVTGI